MSQYFKNIMVHISIFLDLHQKQNRFFRKLVLRKMSVILNFLFVFLDTFENYWEFFTFDHPEVPPRFTF